MSRSLSPWRALLLGAVVLTGVALGSLGLFLIGGRGWYDAGAFHVRAAFREIRGVEVGTRVRLKGMDAGEVVAVLPPDHVEDPVVLRLLLRGDYRRLVRPDSVVRIEGDGLVGGKVLEIKPGPPRPDAAEEGDVAEDQLLQGDSSDLMEQMTDVISAVRQGKGSLGKLLADSEAHDAFVDLMRQGKKTLENGAGAATTLKHDADSLMHQGQKTLEKSEEAATTLQQDADALKRLPVVGGYVEDPAALLQRFNCQRDRRVYDAADLFEPGRAVLTAQGRRHLDGLGPWVADTKRAGSDVVIVGYADPHSANPQAARALSRQQSETVGDYLKTKHAIQKLGWFSSRKVTTLGLGVEPPPLPETEALPPDRVEIQVFFPS